VLLYPTVGKGLKPSRWQKRLPSSTFFAFLAPLGGSCHQHHFGGGFPRTLERSTVDPDPFSTQSSALVLTEVRRRRTPDTKKGARIVSRPAQAGVYALVVHDLDTLDLRFEYQPFGVYQKVRLSTLNLLAAVIPSLLPWTSLPVYPKTFSDGLIYPLPNTFNASLPEPVLDDGPSRKVTRQQALLAATL
jgi:hypothetical protein